MLTITILRIMVMAVCRAIVLLAINTMLDLPHTKGDSLPSVVAEVVEALLALAGVSMLYRRFPQEEEYSQFNTALGPHIPGHQLHPQPS